MYLGGGGRGGCFCSEQVSQLIRLTSTPNKCIIQEWDVPVCLYGYNLAFRLCEYM